MNRKLITAVFAVLMLAVFGAVSVQAAPAKHHKRSHKRNHTTANWRGKKSEPAPATTPAPPHEEGTGFRGHIVHYEQSPGFGGYLRIKNDVTGAELTEFFGEKTDLECAHVLTGPYSPCDKSNLKDGTPVTHAEHAVNDYGHDVWTHVFLYLETAATTPPPEPAPAPAADPAPQGTVVSFTDGVLTIERAGNGEKVSAIVGPSTDLECGPSTSGPWHKCSAGDLKAGRKVAHAQHGMVDGHDTWLNVYLVVS
jgi:hypothetical protein